MLTTQARYGRTTSVWAGRLLGLGMLLLAAVIASVAIPKLRSELAGEGTQGTLTVSSCDTHMRTHYGTRRRSTELDFSCTGTWAAENGGTPLRNVAVDTSSRFETGTKIPVVQVDDTFAQPQDRQPGNEAAVIAICLSMLAFGVYCLLTGFGARNGLGFAASWDRLPARTVMGPVLGGLFALGLLAALVCALAL